MDLSESDTTDIADPADSKASASGSIGSNTIAADDAGNAENSAAIASVTVKGQRGHKAKQAIKSSQGGKRKLNCNDEQGRHEFGVSSGMDLESVCLVEGLALKLFAQLQMPSCTIQAALAAACYQYDVLAKGTSTQVSYGEFGEALQQVVVKTYSHIAVPSIMSEMLFLARCQHKNIASLVDVFGICSKPTLIFTYHGQPLLPHDSWSSWTVSNKQDICMQVLSGLHHMHSQHVVHGDIHARNILISEHNGKRNVVICSLRHCHMDLPGCQGCSDWENYGILDHVPPEACLGTKHVDGKVDAWSFGVLSCHLAMGKKLVHAQDLNDLLQNIIAVIGPPDIEDMQALQSYPGWREISKHNSADKIDDGWKRSVQHHIGDAWLNLILQSLLWSPARLESDRP